MRILIDGGSEMPFPKIYVDAMLLNWGDRVFQEPFRHASLPRLSRGGLDEAAGRMRERLARTLTRSPEVIVKVTNKASGAQGMGALRRHVRYISRHGQVELEDQDGERYVGVDAVRELLLTWQLGGWGMPETSQRREVFNIVLSMPPGTDRALMREAARDFAAREFGGERSYFFAAHNDVSHPHIHLCIQVRGWNGRRLNPRTHDLKRWRERFAEQLCERGISANATPRRTRGVTQRYPGRGVAQMLARGDVPLYWRPTSTEAQRGSAWLYHRALFEAWGELAGTMASSLDPSDRAMAIGIVKFVEAMPIQRDVEPAKSGPGCRDVRLDRGSQARENRYLGPEQDFTR
jgi:hypothetical protein